MTMKTLKDLYVRTLLAMHAAEAHQRRILPEMVRAVSSAELQSIFDDHLERIRQHLVRIEAILSELGIHCDDAGYEDRGIAGLLDECLSMVQDDADPHVKDAALISLALRVSHDKLAEYECARGWATALTLLQAVSDFEAMMDEERRLIASLADLGARINVLATVPGK